MKKQRVTVKDVAKAAGVSLMTVSRAINGQDGIGKETRQRILELAAQMNYQPSQIARSLATRQTNTLGLVVPDVNNPFFSFIARGAEDAAYENGFSVFLINSAENSDRERSALDSLWQKEVNGVILCSSRLPDAELKLSFDRFARMVLVNRQISQPHPNVFSINVDDIIGAELVVNHFLREGRKHLSLIAGPESSQSGQRRKEGFLQCLKQHNLAIAETQILHCPPTVQGGLFAARQLFEKHPETNAISAYNDLVAIGVLQACKQIGKKVPLDVAVIGADDVPMASMVQPTLSTLQVDQYQIGRMAVALLLQSDEFESNTETTFKLTPKLILRESG